MPQVPKYAQQVDPTPLPNVELTRTHDGGAAARAWGQALDDVGQAATRLGVYHLEKAKEERDRAFQNEVSARMYDLENQALTSRDRGPGGKGVKGLLNQTGLEPDQNLQTMLNDVDVQAGELAKEAKTTEQQQWFQAEWTRVRASIERRGLEHASTERTKYRKAAFELALDGSRNRVGLHAATGAAGRQVIADELAKSEQILRASGPEFGLTGEVLDAAIERMRGGIHVAAVEGMLAARQHNEAAQYWAGVRDQVLDNELREKTDDKLKNRTTDAIAIQAVDEVWATIGPKNDRATLEQDKLTALLRDKLRDDPDAYKAALAELGVRIQSHKNAVDERSKRFIHPLLEAIVNKKTTGEIMRMPEWAELDPSERITIFDRAQRADDARAQDARAAVDRTYTLGQRERQLAEQAKWAEYAIYSNPELLMRQSREDMLKNAASLAPADELSKSLVRVYDALHQVDATPAAITLPDDTQRAVFVELGYGFAGAGTPSSWKKDQQALFGRVKAAAEAAIDTEQRTKNGNKPLTLERKKEIAKEILSTTVMVGGVIWGEDERPALDVDPNSPAALRSRVPLERIKRDAPALLEAAIKELRDNGRDEMNQPIRGTDAQILAKWQDRIEKATALRYMKAPDALVFLRTGRRAVK
jgi:hypothetical protein